ncbi:MAG: tetratricopeptide repeat protein [Thermoguttaceae bacterium]
MTPEQEQRLREAAELNRRVYVLWRAGRSREALPLAHEALKIRQQILGLEHNDTAASLMNLGAQYHALGEPAKAEPLYRQALEIRKKVLGENHPDYATSLNNLGGLYRDQGDYARAEPLYKQALEIRKTALGENHSDYAGSLNNLASLYQDQGDYLRAEPLYRQASEIAKKVLGENHPHYAASLNGLAVLYWAQGDYPRAGPLFRKALEIRKKMLGENHPDYANSLDNLASLYRAQGDYARAEPLYKQALEICKKALGEGHPHYAHSLINLASLYQAQGDYPRAEPLYKQALEICKKALGENHSYYATGLNDLAYLYKAQGDYPRAEPLFRKVLEIKKKALGENHHDYAAILNGLAVLYWAQGDYSHAEPLFRQASEIAKKVLGENHPHYALSLDNLAYLYQAQGNYSRAEPLRRQAVSIIRRHIEATAVIQSERQQLAMLQGNRRYLDSYLNLAVDSSQYSEPVYQELLAWKGMVLRRNRVSRAATQRPQLATTFTRLQRVATQLTHLAWTTPDPRQEANWRRRLEELSAEKEELEAELSARSAEYRQAKQAIPLDGLQAALSKDSVLVDFVEYWHNRLADKKSKTKATSEWRLLGFVVAPGRPVEMIDLGPTRPIDEAIRTWRVTFGMSAEGAGAARLLRERLWAPIEEKLHGAKIVLVSPDGALSRLPFGALPGKRPGSFLIEERTFALVPVPQLIPQLVQEEGRKELRKKLLLLGNVDYDALPDKAPDTMRGMTAAPVNDNADGPRTEGLMMSSRSVPPGSLHFGPLPGTEGEICAIEELYRRAVGSEGVTALRKSQAGKEAFLAEARRHGYLHLATHGFFIEEKVRPPALGSRDASRFGEMLHEPEAGRTYPAILCGLALAGANRTAEQQPSPPAHLPIVPQRHAGEGSKADGNQGILTAEEIGTQNLDCVDIVVLSACESGLGKQASGEGVLGLQRSFQSAGVRTVVASLWPVDDAATKALMVTFYTNLWEKKLPKREALRQAQLTMLREYDPKVGKLRGPGAERPVDPAKLTAAQEAGGAKSLSPFYWASFVLSGDWK